MKYLNLYILALVVKSVASFSCEDVYLDSKESLYKATSEQIVETKIMHDYGTEYNTWYIDPCRSVEKEPKDIKNKECPKNSRVCLVKSIEFDGEKEKKVLDIKGYAIDGPRQDPSFEKGDYVLSFEGESKNDSGYSTKLKFSCAGDNNSKPEVELDESKNTVNILWKGICVSDSSTGPVDNGDKKDDKKNGGGHFLIRFIIIIIVCYFIIGMCYNYFVLNKNGIDIIPNVDLWIAIFGSAYDKIVELFGRRDYRPILA